MGSELGGKGIIEDSPQEWLKRLTVKVERDDNACADERNRAECAASVENASNRRHRGSKKEQKERRRRGGSGDPGKAPKEERLLTPTEAPVYTPALAPSQLPFGSSKVVKAGEEAFSAGQLQLLELSAAGTTGLWRMHARSGINYRKGPFTTEERLIVEEALEQYAQREGLDSVEEAVRSLSGNIGRKNCGRFHSIAKCLPERPFVSVYGYIRRRISGNVKRGPWTEEEARQLVQLAKRYPQSARGRWVKIGAVLNRRPADVCEKWRGLQPRLSQFEEASLPALEDKNDSTEAEASAEASGDTAIHASFADTGQFNEAQKQLLLHEVQRKTGEELPSFGIPWRRIQAESFPHCEHAVLRRVFCSVLVPGELERRMGTKPRPVILRHILRCFRRLEGPLPPQLRGVEWLDILPFVPASLQREVVRNAAGSVVREEGASLEAAIPQLVHDHGHSLESMRKKDASRLLRAALPVAVQQALEARVLAKATLKGWPENTIKKKIRKRIRKAAAEELDRLKSRLRHVRASPLNAPPRGRGQRALLPADAEPSEIGDASITNGDADAEAWVAPFTGDRPISGVTLDPDRTTRPRAEAYMHEVVGREAADTRNASLAMEPTPGRGPKKPPSPTYLPDVNADDADEDYSVICNRTPTRPAKRRVRADNRTPDRTTFSRITDPSRPTGSRRKRRLRKAHDSDTLGAGGMSSSEAVRGL